MTQSDEPMTGPEMFNRARQIVMDPDATLEDLHAAMVMAKLAEVCLAVEPVTNFPVLHPYNIAWKEAVHGKS